ncbi:MAG: aspartate carbamoyltransferase regulatory subunit [Patescibacteria group bacterium]
MKTYKVCAIKNGTVIDHIPEKKGHEILGLLNLEEWDYPVTLGIAFTSKKIKKKDIIKIENRELTEEEVNKISIIAPTATISIIKNFEMVKKIKPKIPDQLVNILTCANPACVTNNEPAKTRFTKEPGKELLFHCDYCERIFDLDEIKVTK